MHYRNQRDAGPNINALWVFEELSAPPYNLEYSVAGEHVRL
jgi:hypothetical protein